MPRANQYLLLYVLDLLSVFARKSDKNLMTAKSTYNLLSLELRHLLTTSYLRLGAHLGAVGVLVFGACLLQIWQ